MVKRLHYKRWKKLHSLIYVGSVLVLVHMLLLGSHFLTLTGLVPQLFFAAITVLLFLEAIRIDLYAARRFGIMHRFGYSFLVVTAGLVLAYTYLYFPLPQGTVGINVHSQHILLAKQAQVAAQTPLPANLQGLKSLQGDRTKRFTVSFSHPDTIQANQDVSLTFQVYDASSGDRINLFQTVYDKVIHLVIVDTNLKYYSHIHPTQDVNGFHITTQFPHDGLYHLYADFQPFGAIEQQFAFTIQVGTGKTVFSHAVPDTKSTKRFGNYQVSLQAPNPLTASEMAIGNQTLTFTIRDAKTDKPVTTLRPYLAAFGHLVMINQETFDYLHVHPSNLTAPAPDATGGPSVSFIPLGLYGPIKPGIYRLFAQFNPDNHLFTADFTVTINP